MSAPKGAKGLREMIQDLKADEMFIKRFAEDPHAIIKEYPQLSAEERSSLLEAAKGGSKALESRINKLGIGRGITTGPF